MRQGKAGAVVTNPIAKSVLYAAGFEASAWRSSDSGLTWRRLPGFDFKWAHRVIVDQNPCSPRCIRPSHTGTTITAYVAIITGMLV